MPGKGAGESGRIDGTFPRVLILEIIKDGVAITVEGAEKQWNCQGRVTRRHEDPRNQPDHRSEPPQDLGSRVGTVWEARNHY